MGTIDVTSEICDAEELQDFSREIVDDFLKMGQCQPAPRIELSFHPSWEEFNRLIDRTLLNAVYMEHREDRFFLHLCEEGLRGIPKPALQGWLELKLALCFLSLDVYLYSCNFSRQILPILPVSGSAENFLREVVENLEQGLKRHDATRMIIDVGHGVSQVHFHFHTLTPEADDREEYESTIPHGWVRAHFISQKLKAFMPISLLAQEGIGFAGDLKSGWYSYHEFWLPEDIRLIEELADVPGKHPDLKYEKQIVEMFKIVLPRFNKRQMPQGKPSVLH